MSFTQIIRDYCAKNKGKMIEVSQIKNNEFAEIPYKTILKILNRLKAELILKAVSKGVYYIGNKTFDENTIITLFVLFPKGG